MHGDLKKEYEPARLCACGMPGALSLQEANRTTVYGAQIQSAEGRGVARVFVHNVIRSSPVCVVSRVIS